MPSPAKEAELARVLERAAEECESKRAVWLGVGLPAALRDGLGDSADQSLDLAIIEVTKVSDRGSAQAEGEPPPEGCAVIGLSRATFDELGTLFGTPDRSSFRIERLICPAAVFDFGPDGMIVREIRHGLTAAELQRKLQIPLWAGPDLKELGTH